VIREHTVCATPASPRILVEDTQINYYYPKACEKHILKYQPTTFGRDDHQENC